MINDQNELDNLLDVFTDRFKRVNGRAIHFKPYTVLWKNVNYVGAGDAHMHLLIPVHILGFEPQNYKQFSPVAKLLDGLSAASGENVSVELLEAKSIGLSIATKINGVGFHRKLINKFKSFSYALDVKEWHHITRDPEGLNLFTSNACYALIAAYKSDEQSKYEDDILANDITDFDTASIEELSSEQAFLLAHHKEPIDLPRLRYLSHDAASRLCKHISFEVSRDIIAESRFGEELWSKNNTIHFGPDLIVADDILDCFLDCYSDLVFDNIEMQLRYDDLQEKVLQSRILKRLDEVLFPLNILRIIYSENDNGCSWTVADDIEMDDTMDFIGTDLNWADETEFLSALFYRYEKFHREKQEESLYPYRSYWIIYREKKEFSNKRVMEEWIVR